MLSNKYVLGPKRFKKKSDITSYVKHILNTSKTETIIQGEGSEVLKDLVKWHARYDENWGNQFKTVSNTRNQKNFMIKSKDGQWWDFSYYKCIAKSTLQKNVKNDVIRLFRDSIKYQINEFRNKHILNTEDGERYKCSIDGKLYNRFDTHVDHNYEILTFKQLYLTFLKIHNLDFGDIKLKKVNVDIYFVDNNLKQLWVEYHMNNAKLRIINKVYNLSHKSVGVVPQ
jgi:hypothetical protein